MSAEATSICDYDINYPLVDDVPFHKIVQEVEKHSDRIQKQFLSEFMRKGYTNGRQFDVSVTSTSGEDIDVSIKLLGAGGNGIAYQLKIKDKRYVLKIVLGSPLDVESLVKEIEILKTLKGKWFALQLYASIAVPTTDMDGDVVYNIYMLFPYIGGTTLHHYIENAEGYDEIRVKMNQILEGLHELHKMGIVHNDIKGENIWIPDNPQTKPFFLDFGDSRMMNAKYTAASNYHVLGNVIERNVLRYSSDPKNLSKNLIRKLQKRNTTYHNIKNMTFGGKRKTKKRHRSHNKK